MSKINEIGSSEPKVLIGDKEFFPGVGKIPFEGKKSNNPMAFKYYDNLGRKIL